MAWLVNNPEWADTRMQIGTEELLRPLVFGSNWVKIRIGMRYMVPGFPSTFGPNVMRMGVCNGSLGYSSINCVGWMGVSTSLNLSTWYLQAGSPGYYQAGNSSGNLFYAYTQWKVGQTVSAVAITNQNTWTAGSVPPVHTALFFDITKAGTYLSPSAYLFSCVQKTAAAGNTDITFAAFIEQARTTSAMTNFQNASVSSISNYPGPSAFDTLSIGWDVSFPPLEISDLVVLRIA